MQFILRLFVILMIGWLVNLPASAQSTQSVASTPIVSLISVIEDTANTVRVVGAGGSVFASAQVAIINPYTQSFIITSARGDGSFSATITGYPYQAYEVYSARNFPQGATVQVIRAGANGAMWFPDEASTQFIPFSMGGQLAYGAGYWLSHGRINASQFAGGERLTLILEVRLALPNADVNLPYQFLGQLALRRTHDEQGNSLSTAIGMGEGWSSVLSDSGLPIVGGTVPDTVLFETVVDDYFVDSVAQEIRFRMHFTGLLPDDLADGHYVPVFTGKASVSDSDYFDWYANRVFGTTGTGQERLAEVLIPVGLQVGQVAQARLPLSLFQQSGQENFVAVDGVQLPTTQATFAPSETTFLPLIILGQDVDGFYSQLRGGSFRIVVNDLSCETRITQINLMAGKWVVQTEDPTCLAVATSAEGAYRATVEAEFVDLAGQDYQAGGDYGWWVGSSLTIHPMILSGTPLLEARTEPFIAYSSPLGDPIIGTVIHSTDSLQIVQYTARFADESGRFWSGDLTAFYPIVSDATPAYGVRGLALGDPQPQPWFDTRVYPQGAILSETFAYFPFFSGDVAFLPDGLTFGVSPRLTGGQMQFLSIVHPNHVVRHFVADSAREQELLVNNDDLANGQVGVGSGGARPEDIFFLFGATHDGTSTQGYASLAVVTDAEYAQVVPPFSQPLFSDNGVPVDLFVLPTTIYAGQIVTLGENLPIAGQIAPPVSADTAITISTADDFQQVMTTASPFGFFSETFAPRHAGVYRVAIEAFYDGATSAGLLNQAVAGRVLGAGEDGYYVFVVEPNTPSLATTLNAETSVTSGQSFTIPVSAPQDWQNVQAFYTVRTSQWILDQGTIAMIGTRANYTFDWARIARSFPSLESRATLASDIDEVTFTFAITGTSATGESQIQTRRFTLRGNRLLTFGE